MATTFYLIRHGETDWTREGRYCGITDVDLNGNGRAQAEKLRCRLRGEKIHKVYASDRKRALSFAGIVFPNMDIHEMPDLSEVNFGCLEGLTHSEILNEYPGFYERWLGNLNENFPEGESLNDLIRRVRNGLYEIMESNADKTAAVVTHGGPIRIILGGIYGMDKVWSMDVAPASMIIVKLPEEWVE